MYKHGNGIPVSKGKAFEWYKKAASQGNAKVQYDLGYMLKKD